MPALEAFGRKWHIASDDLPLPMLTLMTFHTIWCVVVMVAYVGAYENLHTCPHGYTFGVYMLCVIFVFAAAWTIEFAIYLASMKGTLLQTSERAIVPNLLVAHLVVSLVDIAFSVFGVVLGIENNLFDRLTCFTGQNARTAVLVVIVGNWVVLVFTFLVVQSVFNKFSGIEVEESWKKRLQLIGNVLRVCGVRGLVGSDTDPMSDAARAFARVFRHIDFVPSDFATSLVLVGISHSEEQRKKEDEEWQEYLAANGGYSGAAPGLEQSPLLRPPQRHLYPIATDPHLSDGEEEASSLTRNSLAGASLGSLGNIMGGKEARDSVYMGCLQGREGKASGERGVNGCIPMGVGVYSLGYDGASTSASAPAEAEQRGGLSSLAQAPKPQNKGPLLRPGLLAQRQGHGQRERDPEMEAVVAEATHYSKFALAPYGWPLYVWAHPKCGVCDLCCACGIRHPLKHRPCFSRCATCGGREGLQDALDVAALVRFANLDEDDILHVSFENGVLGALPYFIARDAKTQSIILSVRGTLSVADCITDLLYEPAGLDGTLLGSNESNGIPAGSMAHNGVLGCARALHADLQKRGTLRDALEAPQHRGWTLIITGHSLGAGVATLLGLMLRSWRPELRVWAFSPPGGLVSENLAEAIKPWVTSVALGNDFISRLSMHNLERLRDEMMQCAALCKLPKFTVLRKAAISGPALRASDVMYSPSQYGGLSYPSAEVAEVMRRYHESVASQGPVRHHVQLYPPGRLLHLVRVGRMHGGADGGTIYWPRWTTAYQLMSRIVVARNMFTNHFPDKMYKELHRLAEALRVPPVETVFARHRPQAPAPEAPPSRSRTPEGGAGGGGAGAGAGAGGPGGRAKTPDRTSPRSRTPPSERGGANTSPRGGANTSPRGGANTSPRGGANTSPRGGANTSPRRLVGGGGGSGSLGGT